DLARQSRSDTKRSKAALESLMKGLQLDAKESGSNSVLVPGGRAAISATVTNSGRETITLHSIQLTIQGQPLPGDQKIARLKPGQAETIHASITVPANSVYTKPNFHRENRETDAVYTIENPASATLPLAPWPLTASAAYALDGGEGIVTATARDSKNSAVPLAIAPPFSISVEPESRIVPSNANAAIELKVSALTNLSSIASADITAVLRQIGLDVPEISPQELASGDLSHYGTISLGIRAYDTRDDVEQHNQRLLDYVSAGGTLVAQYNTDLSNINNGHFSPFP